MKSKLATIVLLFVGLMVHEGSAERAVDCQKQNLCHEHATCVTLDATSDQHTCRCNEGFQGDGVDNCEDINECKLNPCPLDTRCWNHVGGYECFHVSMNAAQHSSPVGFSVTQALRYILAILLAQ